MASVRRLLAWLLGGAAAASIGFFTAGVLVSQPEPAPDALNTLTPFSLPTSSGESFSSDQLAGQNILINFWATWCAPCRREIPLLMATQALHRESLAIVGIAVDELESVLRFEDEVGMNYVSLVGRNEALSLMSRYGNSGQLPFTLVFDRAGRLRFTKAGELHSKDIELWLSELR